MNDAKPGQPVPAGAQQETEKVLTGQQEEAVLALLENATPQQAADRVGVAGRTIYKWMKLPHFHKAYRDARRAAFSQAIGLTQRYASVAVSTLVKVMADEGAPHHAKVSAAIALLRFGRDGIELDDLAARIEALEDEREERNDQRKAERWVA